MRAIQISDFAQPSPLGFTLTPGFLWFFELSSYLHSYGVFRFGTSVLASNGKTLSWVGKWDGADSVMFRKRVGVPQDFIGLGFSR